jgi:uncharacterized delta-60 repeat protein
MENPNIVTNGRDGFDNTIYTIAVQSDGKVLIGGDFGSFGAASVPRLVRLNSDGTLDTTFDTNLGAGFDDTVRSIAIQSDGKILVSGFFANFDSNLVGGLVRLNSDGTEDTAFSTNLGTGFSGSVGGDAGVYAIAVQSDGDILVTGDFDDWDSNARNGLVRFNSDGTEDSTFYTNLGTGFTGAGSGLVPLTLTIQSDDKVILGGSFVAFDGKTRNRLLRLNLDGTEDVPFYTNLGTGFDNTVNTVFLQANDQILVGGSFTTFNTNTRNRLVRLNSNGGEDSAFYTNLGAGFANGSIQRIYEGSNNKLTIVGGFTTFNTNTRNRITQLNSDGTENTAFYTNMGTGYADVVNTIALKSFSLLVGGFYTSFNGNTRNRFSQIDLRGGEYLSTFYLNLGSAADDRVTRIKTQSDGKVLIGGQFTTFNGNGLDGLVRLNSDGTEDTTFSTNLGTGFNSFVNDFDVFSDGSIVVVGAFTDFGGTTVTGIVKLNSDGTENTAFTTNLGAGFTSGFSLSMETIRVQANDQIVISGSFDDLDGTTLNDLVRLNSDGTEDTTFTTNIGTALAGPANDIGLQSDGKIILVGQFTEFNGNGVDNMVRLNSDGTEDTAFTTNLGTGFTGTTNTVVVQSDGKIVIGGDFTALDGNTRNRIIRLNSDGLEDTLFYANIPGGANGVINAALQLANGQIILGGGFSTFGGVAGRTNIAVKLNEDGTEDATFFTNQALLNGQIFAVEISSLGQLLIGGDYSTLDTLVRNNIISLDGIDTEIITQGQFRGLYRELAEEWTLGGFVSIGDVSNIDFSMDYSGQLQYTSDNPGTEISGSGLNEMKYIIFKL